MTPPLLRIPATQMCCVTAHPVLLATTVRILPWLAYTEYAERPSNLTQVGRWRLLERYYQFIPRVWKEAGGVTPVHTVFIPDFSLALEKGVSAKALASRRKIML